MRTELAIEHVCRRHLRLEPQTSLRDLSRSVQGLRGSTLSRVGLQGPSPLAILVEL